MFSYVIGGILAFVVVLYTVLELHYFLRVCVAVVMARCFKKKVHILDETVVTGICLTTDIDTLLYHMNNARFMREVDFARVDFYERSGLYRCIRKIGGSVALGATTIRYRRFVRLFHSYKIVSKIIYWDDQSIFMEHRFISPWDGFINAIVVCRTRILKCNVDEIMEQLMKGDSADVEANVKIVKLQIPPEIVKWNEYNDISSKKLRANSTSIAVPC